jgi:bifunctional non-homologous end joining protein LigD
MNKGVGTNAKKVMLVRDGGNRRVDEIAVGECKDGRLLFVEAVKNGFVPATRREVYQTIANLQIPDCPFVNLPEKKGVHR